MNRNQLLLLAFAGSTLTLAGAFAFQHLVGILPCHLCLLQRYPHAILAVLALVALGIRMRLLALLGAVIALYSMGLAIYHSGVERKLWAGPSDCTGGQDLSGISGADLLSTETAAPIVSCDEISYSILGLSFANLNVIGSAVLLVIWIMAARKR